MNSKTLNIKVARIHRTQTSKGPLLGYADIVINDVLLIKGLRIIEGKKGYFVAMPQEQGRDRKWYDTVLCLTKEVREYINEVILESFDLSPNE